MTDGPERDKLIELLDQLGGDSDEAVLAAARRLHTMVDETGADWDDLLVPPTADTPVDEDEFDDQEDDDQEDEGAADEGAADEDEADEDETAGAAGEGSDMDDAQSSRLIEGLLDRSDISEFLREELEGYKEEIAEGDFVASDRAYLHALNARLKKAK
jgi:hypothetical protein